MEHVPVFLEDVLSIFRSHKGAPQDAWDGTFGRGGHARAVLTEFPMIRLWAMDWDHQAIEFAKQNFGSDISDGRLHLYHSSYGQLVETQKLFPEIPKKFDLMLLDLGVSSPQLDQAERGFSFYHDGPLDMRMDQRQEWMASDLINEWDEQDLARMFIEQGEVQKPYRVVRAIVHDRKTKPFETTRQLASLIERVDGWHKKGSHPATRYFLALRLQVNAELQNLQNTLPKLIESLNDGGILAVISFHSLEDRIVKNIFKAHLEVGHLVQKKVIKPSDAEVERNPRSRSAKLRAFVKGRYQDES